jgi:membrane protease YdiL (CAAX protease family)
MHKSVLKFIIVLAILSALENVVMNLNFMISNEFVSICKDVVHIIILLLFLGMHRNEFKSLNIKKPQKKLSVLCVCLGLLLLSLGSSITDLINLVYPEFISQNENNVEYSVIYTMYFFIYAGIIAPIIEEIEFRRLLLDDIQNESARKASIFIFLAAIMFFSIHTDQFNFGALCLGCVSGLVYYYTNNLLYSIIIHFSGNFTVCSLALLPLFMVESNVDTSQNIDYQEPNFAFSAMYTIIVVLIIIIILKYIRHKNNEFIIDVNPKKSEKNKINYIYVIIYFAICGVSTIIALRG